MLLYLNNVDFQHCTFYSLIICGLHQDCQLLTFPLSITLVQCAPTSTYSMSNPVQHDRLEENRPHFNETQDSRLKSQMGTWSSLNNPAMLLSIFTLPFSKMTLHTLRHIRHLSSVNHLAVPSLSTLCPLPTAKLSLFFLQGQLLYWYSRLPSQISQYSLFKESFPQHKFSSNFHLETIQRTLLFTDYPSSYCHMYWFLFRTKFLEEWSMTINSASLSLIVSLMLCAPLKLPEEITKSNYNSMLLYILVASYKNGHFSSQDTTWTWRTSYLAGYSFLVSYYF